MPGRFWKTGTSWMLTFNRVDDARQEMGRPLAQTMAYYGDASEYCRRFTKAHYENFSVTSILLPREIRRHFWHIYAFCRRADDLADEIGDSQESLRLLNDWERQLQECTSGSATHPVFVALSETMETYGIPQQPFSALLSAFRQDRIVTRYEAHEDVLDYCRRSADPVGQLVLYLGQCHSPQTVPLSDRVCTGLQLANFCQDVAQDWDRGRIYLPQESCRRFGYTDAMFAGREANEAFRHVMRYEVERAREYLVSGCPLVDLLPKQLQRQVSLYIRGGLAILDSIRRINYDVWARRPTVGGWTKVWLVILAGCRANLPVR